MTPEALLQAFRRDCPARTLGNGWTYYVGGNGPETVMLLPGGTGAGELWFPYLLDLRNECRVLAVTYAPVATMAELTDGLAAILDAEGVSAAALVGASLGGMAAQVFARRFPGRVTGLLLANTTVPQPDRVAWARRMERVVRLFPAGLLNRVVVRALAKQAAVLPDGTFWEGYFRETYDASMGKARFISQYQLMADFCTCRFAPGDLAATPSVQIVESDDDAKVEPQLRQALRDAYPGARVHTFAQGGHLSALTHRAEFLGLIRSLLKS